MKYILCPGYIKRYYPLYYTEDKSHREFFDLLPKDGKVFLIYDTGFYTFHPEFIDSFPAHRTIRLPVDPLEDNKSFTYMGKLFEQMLDHKPTIDDIVVIVGGGLVLNLGGMIASLTIRGMQFCYVPTTFTAQIDAGIGSKQAVNFRQKKNWIGMYNDPMFSYINTTFLLSLPEIEMRSQIVEGVKLALVYDEKLYHQLVQALSTKVQDMITVIQPFLKQLLQLKIRIIGKDLLEQHIGGGMLYGHTVGHALETASDYELNHGQAVGIGMLCAASISKEMGLATNMLVETHENILTTLGIPNRISNIIPISAIQNGTTFNKKNTGEGISFYLLKDVGQLAQTPNGSYLHHVPDTIVYDVISKYHD